MYRFAPSPTGDMHIGNLRAALINFVLSCQDKSGFYLRIEDTDTARNIEGKDAEIQELLRLFGVEWSALYYQSKNLKFHQQFAAKLLTEKKAFLCFCDEATLEAKKQAAIAKGEAYRYDGACEHLTDEAVLSNPKSPVVRLRIDRKFNFDFKDEIKGEIKFDPANFDSFVLLRADKTPTYNFACAVDDMLEGTTCVVRGEDHISNTPRQNLIRHALGFTGTVRYAHLPIILNVEGKKMSKRESSSSVKWLLSRGYMPEAIANYLLLLGNKTPCELFTLDEAVAWFSLSNLSKSPAKFDEDKLAQLNREHVKRASDERLFELGLRHAALARFYTQESSLLGEIKARVEAIYAPKKIPDEWAQKANLVREAVVAMCEVADLPEDFVAFRNELSQRCGLKGKELFMPLRLLLTGAEHGPELKELYALVRDDVKAIVTA